VVSLSFYVQDWIKDTCKTKTISSLTNIIRNFIEYGSSQSQTNEETLQNITTTLKREGFFRGPLIGNLRETHHALEDDSIGNIHHRDENSELVVAPLIEDEEPEQYEDFSQRMKEIVREYKKFCKEPVDQCQDVHLLIELCAQI